MANENNVVALPVETPAESVKLSRSQRAAKRAAERLACNDAEMRGYREGVEIALDPEAVEKAAKRAAIADERAIRESALGLTAAFEAARARIRAETPKGERARPLTRAEKARIRADVLGLAGD